MKELSVTFSHSVYGSSSCKKEDLSGTRHSILRVIIISIVCCRAGAINLTSSSSSSAFYISFARVLTLKGSFFH